MTLDDVFLIDSGGDAPLSPSKEIQLDEINNLDTVIRLSLEAYKSMMDDITFIEVKNRVKHLEVAERYLSTAKDSIYKKECLLAAEKKAKGQGGKPVGDGQPTDESLGGSTRDELYEKRRQKQNQ